MTQPTPTIVQEGNPETNELTVAGTLDGECVLKFEGFVPYPERPLPDAN